MKVVIRVGSMQLVSRAVEAAKGTCGVKPVHYDHDGGFVMAEIDESIAFTTDTFGKLKRAIGSDPTIEQVEEFNIA